MIPLTFDFMFTSMFNKKNIAIIENFLSCYLEIPLRQKKGKWSIYPRNLDLESKHAANKQVDKVELEKSTFMEEALEQGLKKGMKKGLTYMMYL